MDAARTTGHSTPGVPDAVALPMEEMRDLPSPESLTAPRWLPGYHWEYRTTTGKWLNHTVLALEDRGGRPAYKVKTVQSPPNDFGEAVSTGWIDQATLGLIEASVSSYSMKFSPPNNQHFPMQARDYNVSASFAGMGGTDRIHYTVHGWQSLPTPAGTFAAVKTESKGARTNETFVSWYSPTVLNTVAWDDDPHNADQEDLYRLASWGKAQDSLEALRTQTAPTPDPATLTPPRWLRGHHWEYRTREGLWQNWTVLGTESLNGRMAYRVRIEFTPQPGYERIREFHEWFDPETLGKSGQQIGRGQDSYDPPLNQAFPMRSRDYTSTWQAFGMPPTEMELHYEVAGWEDLYDAAAPANGIRLETQYKEWGTNVMWYNPEVEGFMGYNRGDTYLLASWGKHPDS